MPDLDGIEVMRQLRERRATMVMPAGPAAGYRHGQGPGTRSRSCIAKPLPTPDELAARVARAVMQHSSASAGRWPAGLRRRDRPGAAALCTRNGKLRLYRPSRFLQHLTTPGKVVLADYLRQGLGPEGPATTSSTCGSGSAASAAARREAVAPGGVDVGHGLLLDVEPRRRRGLNGEDGYSGFSMRDPESGADNADALDGLLRERAIEQVVVCGLATDYCVNATALDAIRLGYGRFEDAVAAVDLQPGDGERATDQMIDAGCHPWQVPTA